MSNCRKKTECTDQLCGSVKGGGAFDLLALMLLLALGVVCDNKRRS